MTSNKGAKSKMNKQTNTNFEILCKQSAKRHQNKFLFQ